MTASSHKTECVERLVTGVSKSTTVSDTGHYMPPREFRVLTDDPTIGSYYIRTMTGIPRIGDPHPKNYRFLVSTINIQLLLTIGTKKWWAVDVMYTEGAFQTRMHTAIRLPPGTSPACWELVAWRIIFAAAVVVAGLALLGSIVGVL